MHLGPGFAADAVAIAARIAAPPVGPYLACLGDLLGADIRLCRDFGLNVHGKALYFVIHSAADTAVITDRNVHDRLVQLAGSFFTTWAPRQTPGAEALTVTIDGMPAALAPDGSFALTVAAPTGHATVLVTTAAGDRTSSTVP